MAQHDGKLRGLAWVLPTWSRAYVVDELSTWTEADPAPGTARTDGTLPRLAPQIVGAQSQTIEVDVLSGGAPQLGDEGLRLGYRLAEEAPGDIRSYEPPTHITDVCMWSVGDGVHTYCDQDVHVDACRLDLSGRIACLSSGSSGGSSASFAVYNPHTDVFENGQILTAPMSTLLGVPGTDRILLLRPSATWVSDDYGLTWTVSTSTGWSDETPSATFSSTFGRVRSAYDGAGNVLVIAQDTSAQPKTYGYASSDDGATWSESWVVNPTGTERLRWDLAVHPDGYVLFVYYDPNTAGFFAKRLGSAYDNPADLSVEGEIGSGLTPSAVHLAVDDNGIAWAYVVPEYAAAAPKLVHVYSSADGGATWTHRDAVQHDPTAHPQWAWVSARLVPCALGGLFGPVSEGEDNGTTQVGTRRTVCARVGGWRTMTVSSHEWASNSIAFWWALQYPAYDWTLTTSGGAAGGSFIDGGYLSTIDAEGPWGYWRTDAGSGVPGTYYYSATIATVDSRLGSVRTRVRVDSDGGFASDSIAATLHVQVQTCSAADNERRTVQLRWDLEGYRVWDVEAGAWMGDKVYLDLSIPTWFELSVGINEVQVRYHQRVVYVAGTPTPADHTVWTETVHGTPATAATVSSTSICQWGVFSAVDGAAISWWYLAARTAGAASTGGYDGRGVGLATYSYPIPDASDPVAERVARLRVRGSAVAQEEYTIEPTYAYSLGALGSVDEPSPATLWRSVDRTGPLTIAVPSTVDGDAAIGTHPGAQLGLALVVQAANMQYVQVLGWEAPGVNGAEVVIGTLNLAEGWETLSFARVAGTDYLTPIDAGILGARRARAGELRGGFAILDPSGIHATRPGPWYLRIRDNSAGWWDPAKGLRMRIYLDGLIDAVHPADGEVSFVAPSGVLVITTADDQPVYSHVGVFVEANQGGVEDYYTLKADLCAVVYLGKQWDNGTVWTLTPNTRSTTDEYGTTRTTQLGPAPIAWELNWTHGTKHDRVRAGDEWLGTDTLTPVAGRDDVAWQLWDLFVQAEGGGRPVLVLGVDASTYGVSGGEGATFTTVLDSSLWLFGRIASDLRVVTQQGDEVDDAYVLPGPVVVRQLV